MIRARNYFKLKSGEGWNDFLQAARELNERAREQGRVEGTLWTQVAGPFNEIVIEFEYPDLASFEKETEAFYADDESLKALLKWRAVVVEGTGHNELWTSADPVGS